MKKIKIDAIEYNGSKLLGDLIIEKGFEIEKIKKLEIRLEKLKIPKQVVGTITKKNISKQYLSHYKI